MLVVRADLLGGAEKRRFLRDRRVNSQTLAATRDQALAFFVRVRDDLQAKHSTVPLVKDVMRACTVLEAGLRESSELHRFLVSDKLSPQELLAWREQVLTWAEDRHERYYARGATARLRREAIEAQHAHYLVWLPTSCETFGPFPTRKEADALAREHRNTRQLAAGVFKYRADWPLAKGGSAAGYKQVGAFAWMTCAHADDEGPSYMAQIPANDLVKTGMRPPSPAPTWAAHVDTTFQPALQLGSAELDKGQLP